MLNGIAGCRKPGGRFVTINSNPAFHFPAAPSFRKYGFETRVPGEWRGGGPLHWVFFLAEGPPGVWDYHLSVATPPGGCRFSGFTSIPWRPLLSSPARKAAFGVG